jgi:hypothetical protein
VQEPLDDGRDRGQREPHAALGRVAPQPIERVEARAVHERQLGQVEGHALERHREQLVEPALERRRGREVELATHVHRDPVAVMDRGEAQLPIVVGLGGRRASEEQSIGRAGHRVLSLSR